LALDWERLAAVRRATAVPLSLHGASGLDGAAIRRALEGGVTKVNVNTELRGAYLAATAAALADVGDGQRVLDLHRVQAAAVDAHGGDARALRPRGGVSLVAPNHWPLRRRS